MMVVGLEVAVDDAGGMRVGERVGDLDGEIDRRGAGSAARPPMVRLQRLARHELEDEEQLVLILADLVQRGDVRMRQRGGGARVLDEAGRGGPDRRRRRRRSP